MRVFFETRVENLEPEEEKKKSSAAAKRTKDKKSTMKRQREDSNSSVIESSEDFSVEHRTSQKILHPTWKMQSFYRKV